MSGRLVILPHKSWNVWNQDNREKVLRDERIHREAESKAKEDERRRIREKNYEQLTGNVQLSNHTDTEALVEEKPFRLFEDIETQAAAKLVKGNEEYAKERKEQERKKRKREGLEDWALGEGSFEKKGTRPWYFGGSQTNNQDPEKMKKDVIRKESEDPMARYVKYYIPDTYANESKEDSLSNQTTTTTAHYSSSFSDIHQENFTSSKKAKTAKNVAEASNSSDGNDLHKIRQKPIENKKLRSWENST